MKLKPIRTKKEYQACLDRADKMFDKRIRPDSKDGEILQVLLLLIKAYEDRYYPIPTDQGR